MEIKDNGVICAAPWSHLYIQPNGDVYPCCTATEIKFGNANEKSLNEIWNSGEAADFRKNLIAGIPQSACKYCYKTEQYNNGQSLRTTLNKRYGDAIKYDGKNVELSIQYLDVRSSNICNFKCVMCNEALSSAWHDDVIALDKLNNQSSTLRNKKYIEINKDTKEEIFKILPGVKEIYFAGGEPLLTDFHYKMLDFLVKHNLTDVALRYNTNLSVLDYKGKSVLDYWRKFSNIKISASIDLHGEKGEYHRHGFSWLGFKDNVLKIKTLCPDIIITPQITLTSLSIGYLSELIIETHDLFSKDMYLDYNFCMGPAFFNPQTLPPQIKNLYIHKLQKTLELDYINSYERIVLTAAIDFLREPMDFSKDVFETLIKYLNELDKIRYPATGSYWKTLWPELTEDYYTKYDDYFLLLKDKHVLEYACYIGDWWSVLRSYHPKSITAFDPGGPGISGLTDKAKYYDVEYSQIGYEDFKSDKQFDVIICAGLLHKLASPFHLIEDIANRNSEYIIFETTGEYWPNFIIETPVFHMTNTLTETFNEIVPLPKNDDELMDLNRNVSNKRLPWVLHTVIPNLVVLAFKELGYEMLDFKNISSEARPSKANVCGMLFKRM